MRIDWNALLSPEHALEVVVRGTLMYLVLLVLLRVLGRREMSTLAPSDLLVLVIIADAAQNGLAGEYTSVTDGLLLVVTILVWSLALDWAAYHFRWVERLVKPPPIPLVQDGRLLWRNMRRELVTEEELRAQLRKHDVHGLDEVECVRLENDGRVSVVRKE